MHRHVFGLGFCGLLLALSGSFSGTAEAASRCSHLGIAVHNDFPAGGMAGCVFVSDRQVNVQIVPESQPINPSPWYAVAITTEEAVTLQVTLQYGDYQHRYAPKLRVGDTDWTLVPDADVVVSEDESAATITIHLPAHSDAILAAQPIMDMASYQDWIDTLPDQSLVQSEIGRSQQDRPLWRLTSTPRAETLLIMGRQHPPETTGAQAMKFFIERLLAQDELATDFRARVGLLVYPLVNPDGVDNGHWRQSVGGVDLNRDWGPFTQTETRQINDNIGEFLSTSESTLIKSLDFHSTYREIFYTQEDGTPTVAPQLLTLWLAAFETEMRKADPAYQMNRNATNNAGLPTNKNYFHERYGVASTTVEIADTASTTFIERYAHTAAETLMRSWLSQR